MSQVLEKKSTKSAQSAQSAWSAFWGDSQMETIVYIFSLDIQVFYFLRSIFFLDKIKKKNYLTRD